MMELSSQELFARGDNYGFSRMELYREKTRSLSLRVFNQEVDHYGIAENQGMALRALHDGKIGYAYSEKIDQASMANLLEQVQDNIRIISSSKGEIFSGSEEYQTINPYSAQLVGIKPEKKIELVKRLEQAAFNRDERVAAVNYCLYSDLEIEKEIKNSMGLELNYANNLAYLYLSVVAKEGEEIRTGSHFMLTQDFSEFDVVKIANQAVDEALSLFGASSLPSGNYPVILRYDVIADLLATFATTLSAESVQKGLSLFQGKLGQAVAAQNVTIVDDPFFSGGAMTAPFDAEGVATRKKKVIEQGRLTTYLHNLKTARQDGVESTGNAFRGSYKGFIDIAPTNMYIEPGDIAYQDLIASLERGIVIINVQGLHSGANPVSGDFSLGAYGYLVEDGKITRPVDQITIAGNFLEVLKRIELVGDDFVMSLPGAGHFGAPSVMIKKLAVAGE